MINKILHFIKKISFIDQSIKKKINPNVKVGRHVYGDYKVWDWEDGGKLEIGNFCSIGQNVEIYLGGNHRADWISTYPFPAFKHYWEKAEGIKNFSISKGNVKIGNDIWIGNGSKILSGVTIGDGAIIGAYSIVTKDVEPFSIVAGNPAKVIGSRFDQITINKLIEISWWNWDDEKINSLSPYICQNDLNLFFKQIEKTQ